MKKSGNRVPDLSKERGFQGPIQNWDVTLWIVTNMIREYDLFSLGHTIVHTCRYWEAIKRADLSSDLWVWVCLSKYVTSGTLLNLSVPQFPYIYKMQMLTGLLSTLLGELNVIILTVSPVFICIKSCHPE